jgi:hypothetical protein
MSTTTATRKAKILGPVCCRCHDPRKVAPFPHKRMGQQCVDCFMRPIVIVQIAERLQKQEVTSA